MREYRHDGDLHAAYMGSIQTTEQRQRLHRLGRRALLLRVPRRSASVLLDGALPSPNLTYRAIVEPWVGAPQRPAGSGRAQRRRRDDGLRELERIHRGLVVARAGRCEQHEADRGRPTAQVRVRDGDPGCRPASRGRRAGTRQARAPARDVTAGGRAARVGLMPLPPLSMLDLAPIVEGVDGRRRPPELARPRPARRAPGLPTVLARRAPQRGRHRERRDSRRDRARRRRHVDDPRRRGRDHAPEPRADRDRRAVRHARGAASGPDRPRPRPRARHRPADGARAAPRPDERRHLPAGGRRAAALPRRAASPARRVRATPGAGSRVPLWILGSSLFGAQLAAMLGLPYAFASHFAPDALLPALDDLPSNVRAVRAARRSRTRWSAQT